VAEGAFQALFENHEFGPGRGRMSDVSTTMARHTTAQWRQNTERSRLLSALPASRKSATSGVPGNNDDCPGWIMRHPEKASRFIFTPPLVRITGDPTEGELNKARRMTPSPR
jgi:hypothetical protein